MICIHLVGDLLKCEVLRLGYFEEDEDCEDDHHGQEQKERVLLHGVLDSAKEQNVTLST